MNGTGLLAVIDMLGNTITQLQERVAMLETQLDTVRAERDAAVKSVVAAIRDKDPAT